MLGYPIHEEIKKTLEHRQKVLKRGENTEDNPYSPNSADTKKDYNLDIQKTTYINMFSSPKLISDNDDATYDNINDSGDILISNQTYYIPLVQSKKLICKEN